MERLTKLVTQLLWGRPATGDRIYERPVREIKERTVRPQDFNNWAQYHYLRSWQPAT